MVRGFDVADFYSFDVNNKSFHIILYCLIVTNTNHTNSITIGIFENMTNGNSTLLTIQQGTLALLKSTSNFHKERVFKSGVVGVELNLNFHCVNRITGF